MPKSVTSGRIIKNVDEDGNKHYDFQFENKRGYKTTIEGLSEKFNKEYWNYAKLISGVLRWRMPIDRVIKLVDSLQLDSEKHQHLEKRCRTCSEKICYRRNESRRSEVSELRT